MGGLEINARMHSKNQTHLHNNGEEFWLVRWKDTVQGMKLYIPWYIPVQKGY